MEKLKSCPFCGKIPTDSEPSETEEGFKKQKSFLSVQCWNCNAEGGCATTEKKAIKRWNKRS